MAGCRKGQFYTIIAILVIIPAMILVTQYVSSERRGGEIYGRVVSDQAHQVEASVEKDFERALVTSGKRALIGIGDKIILRGEAVNNSVPLIKEMMENGTFYGNESLIMVNNTMSEWMVRISSFSTSFLFSTGYSDVYISNHDGFSMNFSSYMNISVRDQLGIVSIERGNLIKSVLVSVEGMEDPIFPLNTNGLVTRSIRSSPYQYHAKKIVISGYSWGGSCSGEVSFEKGGCDTQKILVAENSSGVVFSCWAGVVIEAAENLTGSSNCFITGNSSSIEAINGSITATGYPRIYIDEDTKAVWHMPIEAELDDGYYFTGGGPDYLERLEGELTPTTNSLETFVNGRMLESYGIPVRENQISLDYLYFAVQDYIGYGVRGLPTWFKVDQNIADRYNLTELFEG
jgi:hypothetical protein